MSSVESIGRMLLALSAVLFIVWVLGRAVRRTRRPSDAVLDVLARKQLSRNAGLAIVRIADRAVVLGLTDNSVSLLGEADLAAVQKALPAAAAQKALPAVAVPPTRPRPVHASGPTRPAPGATEPARTARTARTAGTAQAARPASGALAGSALSPATWKQSLDALRDLTVRKA